MSKTPVSLLQELAIKRRLTPRYELVQIEGVVHEPIFRYRVYLSNWASGYGFGQSKKKAKQEAARSLLLSLVKSGDFSMPDELLAYDDDENEKTRQDGKCSEYSSGNPIGSLQELCVSRRLPPPVYELEVEVGSVHEKQFTIICHVKEYSERGSGKSKKIAKRQAASQMLKTLESIPFPTSSVCNCCSGDEDDDLGICHKRICQKESKYKKLSDVHLSFQNYRGKRLEELQINIDLDDPKLDHVKLLDEISKELKFDIVHYAVDERNSGDDWQHIVQLTTTPLATLYGSGKTREGAKVEAVKMALKFLRQMTANPERSTD